MKIALNDEGDWVELYTLEDIERYMKQHPNDVLYWSEEEAMLCIEGDYIKGME
jgi:hypothetical protein